MVYQKETNVICLGDPKQSALFFDDIIPISYFFEIMFRDESLDLCKRYSLRGLPIPPEEILKSFERDGLVIASLLGPDFTNKKTIESYLRFFGDLFAWIAKFASLCGKMAEGHKLYSALTALIGDSVPDSIRKASVLIRDTTETHIKANGPIDLDAISFSFFSQKIYPILLDLLCLFYIENVPNFGKSGQCFRDYLGRIPEVKKGYRIITLSSSCFEYLQAENNDVSVYLSDIRLVDTRKTEWNKIIEFRKDIDSKRKLRNLRLFFYKTYKGESLSFIKADLQRRLEEYNEICKDWGFDTTTSMLSAIMDSRNLHLTFGTFLASAILGGPGLLTNAALGGSLIEIGKIALCFAKAKHSFQKLKNSHDMAFLIEAKRMLEKS